MHTEVDGQRTPLDEGFVTSFKGTREGPLVCMDALVPGQIRSAAKSLQSAIHLELKGYFCAALPAAGKWARFLLTIRVLQIDKFKNVHSIVG